MDGRSRQRKDFESNGDAVSREGEVDFKAFALPQHPTLTEVVRAEKSDNSVSSSWSADGDDDPLDHVVLKERQRTLLLSRLPILPFLIFYSYIYICINIYVHPLKTLWKPES